MLRERLMMKHTESEGTREKEKKINELEGHKGLERKKERTKERKKDSTVAHPLWAAIIMNAVVHQPRLHT